MDILRCSVCGQPIGLLDLSLDDKHDFCAQVERQNGLVQHVNRLAQENARLRQDSPSYRTSSMAVLSN